MVDQLHDEFKVDPGVNPLIPKYGYQAQVLSHYVTPGSHAWRNYGELGKQIDNLGNISLRIGEGELPPDTYLEHLSHHIAYHDLQVGMILPGPKAGTFLEVKRIFKNADGLIAFGLESENPTVKPILLFQGTDFENMAHLHLDTDPDIGAEAVRASLPQLGEWLDEHPGATLTGHSLGGAKAQQLAARHPAGVKSVVTFCSPGIKRETAKMLPSSVKEVRHYMTEKDPVPLFGETHLTGKMINLSGSHTVAQAHTVSALLERNTQRDKYSVRDFEGNPQQIGTLEKIRSAQAVQKRLHQAIEEKARPQSRSRRSPLHPDEGGSEMFSVTHFDKADEKEMLADIKRKIQAEKNAKS
ncbi:MAG: hypothetical protein V4534_06390 [Myxococcota bacterium]